MTSKQAGISLLVLDDNEDDADMLGALLEQQGHRVPVASGGARALELLEEELPSLVMLDVELRALE